MPGLIKFYSYFQYYFRKRFKEKYIIIESDDWGLERGVTDESIDWLERKFGKENLSRWSYDALETGEDLMMLYDLLDTFRDKFENAPVITANFITHNIDYSNSDSLSFIPLTAGFNIGSEDVRRAYNKGIDKGYIFPQLHGYSHYNIKELREYFETDEGKEAFQKKFLTGKSTVRKNFKKFQGELSNGNDLNYYIKEAAVEFQRFFGFRSSSIIPPTFILDPEIITKLKDNQIKLIQSSNRLQTTDKKRYFHPNFQKRKDLYWSIRNARLDPDPGYDFYHGQCLSSIEKAFAEQSPAVIDFHRVNFSGRYAPEYRERTLDELSKLLNSIYSKWPDAKFIHTQQLTEMLWQQQTR